MLSSTSTNRIRIITNAEPAVNNLPLIIKPIETASTSNLPAPPTPTTPKTPTLSPRLNPINSDVVATLEGQNLKQIVFADGVNMFISKEWFDKYEKLKSPVIFRNSNVFKNAIYPLLTGETIRYSGTASECVEFGQLLEEIGYYGIELTSKQMQLLSENSGFNVAVHNVKKFIESNNKKCCKSISFKNNFKIFNESWKQYIKILTIHHPGAELEKFECQHVFELISSSDHYALITINTMKHNVIFEFVHWFDIVVMQKQPKKFNDYINNFTLTICDDSNDWLKRQLSELPVNGEIKAKIESIIHNASIISNMIGEKKH